MLVVLLSLKLLFQTCIFFLVSLEWYQWVGWCLRARGCLQWCQVCHQVMSDLLENAFRKCSPPQHCLNVKRCYYFLVKVCEAVTVLWWGLTGSLVWWRCSAGVRLASTCWPPSSHHTHGSGTSCSKCAAKTCCSCCHCALSPAWCHKTSFPHCWTGKIFMTPFTSFHLPQHSDEAEHYLLIEGCLRTCRSLCLTQADIKETFPAIHLTGE